MKRIISSMLLLSLLFAFSACAAKLAEPSQSSVGSVGTSAVDAEETSSKKAEYHQISAEEAKKQLDENTDVLLLDVRTQAEYDEKHIAGALLIPDNEIENRAQAELVDKDATILIYCRSGNRSKTASKKLVELGYTHVYDLGGINDYPYATVSK